MPFYATIDEKVIPGGPIKTSATSVAYFGAALAACSFECGALFYYFLSAFFSLCSLGPFMSRMQPSRLLESRTAFKS